MDFKNYRIHTLLRTLSPLHIAAPGPARLKMSDWEPVYYESRSSHDSLPLTMIQRLPVLNPDSTLPVKLPVIAANNIAGRLRRHAAEKVINVLMAKGQKITTQTYSALTCGAVTGNPDGRNVQFSEYKETRMHPYIGLFGGGPRMMRRYVRVFNAVPYTDKSEFMFSRVRHPNLNQAHKSRFKTDDDMIQRWAFRRIDDLESLANMPLATASIDSFASTIADRQKQIMEERAKLDDDETKNRYHTRAFSALEFVMPGVTFPLSFELNVNEAQLGLFLLTLDSFAATERLGGHSRNGFGQFSLDDVVIESLDDKESFTGVFNESKLQPDHQFVARMLGAWTTAADSINADDLNRLLAPPPEEETKRGKKAAKQAAAAEAETEGA